MRVLFTPTALLGLLLLGAAGRTWAGESSQTKAARAKAKQSLDLGLGSSLGEVPKADGLVTPASEKATLKSTPDASAGYEVVSVRHARAFVGAAGGAKPVAPIEEVKLSGTPPTTEKFSTVVRVKSPQRVGATIEVVLLDPRSDTVMSASGQLSYPENGTDEAEYQVEWAPTPVRAGGEYHVLVRVGGRPLGTWPLRIATKG